MINFQKIYGLYGLEHYTVEILFKMVKGGKEKEMSPWRQTHRQPSANKASQLIDKGLLTFAM